MRFRQEDGGLYCSLMLSTHVVIKVSKMLSIKLYKALQIDWYELYLKAVTCSFHKIIRYMEITALGTDLEL